MSHDKNETDTVSKLSDIVHQLSRKVEQLEAALASATTMNRTGSSSRTRSSTLATLTRLNDDVLPSMNMDAFLAYLASMPCDVESVVDKKSSEIIADLVIDGYRNLCAQYSAKLANSANSTKFIPPIANVSISDSQNTLCLFDSTESKWIVCTPIIFSKFAARAYACIVNQCNRWREKNMGPPRSFYAATHGAPEEPRQERDPLIVAKHHKMLTKTCSINLGSTGLMARTKKLVNGAITLKLV
jgi:hypothetical protein